MAKKKKARGCLYGLNDNSLYRPVFLECVVEVNISLLIFADGNAGSQLTLAKKRESIYNIRASDNWFHILVPCVSAINCK
mmetsp:Transcript_9217/g.13897  ORF Transcript_9217/g.13897 Transcript_9217/m.13897 type:complete len:80 (+) Transcript_9217:562-801(+)